MMTLSIFIVSILGSQATLWLVLRLNQSTVRASALAALTFATLCLAFDPPHSQVLQLAFFGATFVGMSDRSRLGVKRVFAASLIYALIFIFLLPFAKGLGGGLGASAFLSCTLVHFLTKPLINRKGRS